MKISKLVSKIECLYIGKNNNPVFKVKEDSRKIERGDIFITHAGARTHAIESEKKGASVIVTPCFIKNISTSQIIGDTSKLKKDIIQNLYVDELENIKVVGITGTDGKTTTSMLTNNIINESNKSACIGTLGIQGSQINIKTSLTTPVSSDLANSLKKLRMNNHQYAVVECSSHGLFQDRIDPIKLHAAAMNRVTRDHLDFHGNENYYFKAKSLIFSKLDDFSPAIINSSCPSLQKLQKKYPKLQWITWGRENADIVGRIVSKTVNKSVIEINLPNRRNLEIKTNLVGDFQIENILASICLSYGLGISEEDMVSGIKKLKNVPGRMEKINTEKRNVFIDYAHTPNAIKKSIKTLKTICKGKIFAVFGCGGDRDKGKRAQMAKAGLEADRLFITSDNPRTEDPKSIIKDMLSGIGNKVKELEVEIDRKKAIKNAIQSAKKEDIVLIAGKGHEDYQLIGEKTIPHNDSLFAKEVLSTCA